MKTPTGYVSLQQVPKEALIRLAHRMWQLSKEVIDRDEDVVDCLANFGRRETMAAVVRYADHGVWQARVDATFANAQAARKEGRIEEADRLTMEGSTELFSRVDFAKLPEQTLAESESFRSMAEHPDGQLMMVGLVKWADGGFPQINLGHRYAAALLCTNAGPEALKNVRQPWPSFFIDVPDGLLEIWDDSAKVATCVTRILVLRVQHSSGERRWAYIAWGHTNVSVWRVGVTTEELLPPRVENNMWEHYEHAQNITAQDERTLSGIGRLIVNACLAMSDPEAVKEVGPGHRSYRHTQSSRRDPEPIVRTFVVGRPIKHDFRDRVQQYYKRGAGRAVNVQVLVAGHWKGQHFGPQNRDYKSILIEPYWRGPVDAPIVLRPHVLDREPKTTDDSSST